jgi:hypothetical protein
MYTLLLSQISNTPNGVIRDNENTTSTSFGFHPDNTDYQRFKADLANGVALSDAEGNPMTADQIKTFLEGLA